MHRLSFYAAIALFPLPAVKALCVGETRRSLIKDRIADEDDIRDYAVVGEAKRQDAVSGQPLVAASVGDCGVVPAMPTAIDLDRKTRLRAEEVENVGTDRRLPSESQPHELPAFELSPEPQFGGREADAHRFAEASEARVDILVRHERGSPLHLRFRGGVKALSTGETRGVLGKDCIAGLESRGREADAHRLAEASEARVDILVRHERGSPLRSRFQGGVSDPSVLEALVSATGGGVAPPTASPFPPTMRVAPSASADGGCMIPPPHSGADAAAPERRGGIAVERRWAGALRLGARHRGAS